MRYVTVEQPIDLRNLNNRHAHIVKSLRDIEPHRRSAGLHLSDIVKRMARESGQVKEKIVFGRNVFDEIDEEDLAPCMALGFASEDMILSIFPWMRRIGEVVKDGIAMSPDAVAYATRKHLLCPNRNVNVLCELKCTWKSSKRLVEEHISYMRQMKSYCYALDTPYAILAMFHVNGDYKFDGPNAGPHLYFHHIEFTAFELHSNWTSVQQARKRYGI